MNRDSWRELEPYMGSDVPNREVVLLDDVKALLDQASDCAPSMGDNSIKIELLSALEGSAATIKKLLEVTRVVSLTCEHLHHQKSDRHGIGDPCPVEARIVAAIERARGQA